MISARRRRPKTTAMYVGSLDILTFGHIDVISTAAAIFDSLIVILANNPNKNHIFTLEERKIILEECLTYGEYIGNGGKRYCIFDEGDAETIRVEILDDKKDGYAIEYGAKLGADYYVRGIRNVQDYQFEDMIGEINQDINQFAPTPVWLPASRSLKNVSSSIVKQLIGPKGWEEVIHPYVPPPVYKRLIEKYNGEIIPKLQGSKR